MGFHTTLAEDLLLLPLAYVDHLLSVNERYEAF